MRVCTKCEIEKPLEMFEKSARSLEGRTRQCKACRLVAVNAARRRRRAAGLMRPPTENQLAYYRAWGSANRDRRNASQRKSKYGLTASQYAELIQRQRGCCAICAERMDPPHVDHDHATGVVRGLLCGHCNRALGLLRDRPEVAQRAAEYLLQTRDILAMGA